jgi:hypothetical protein
MATVNQTIPRSGQPQRFSFHMETNDRTTQVRLRNTISHRLKAIIVSSGFRCGMGREDLCRVGKSDRGVLDAAPRQLWAVYTLALNGT